MKPKEFLQKCKGVVVVQYCPYTNDGESIDLEALKSNTKFLVDFAKDGNKDIVIMTNGSTTEFYANTEEEQKAVIKTVVDTVGGAIPVIAGVSHSGTKEAIKMARYAQDAGADCAMVVIPYYHTPLTRVCISIIKIAESVDIAVMVYNNPHVSGALISPDLMAKLAKIENIVGLKDNTTFIADYFYKTYLIDPDEMALLCGLGEIGYVGAAAYGHRYKGYITFFGNFAPQLSYELYEAVEKERDFVKAQEILKKVAPLFRLVGKFSANRQSPSIIPEGLRTPYAYMDLGKAAMDLIPGLYGGPLRLPLQETTAEEKKELEQELRKLGLV